MLNPYHVRLIESLRTIILSQEFLERYRMASNHFIRVRKLSFFSVIMLMLQKSLKSLQLTLNELCKNLTHSITASAYSQARMKLNPEAFKHLLEHVRDFMYSEMPYKTYQGYILTAVDGSIIHLPNNKENIKHYGIISQTSKNIVHNSCPGSLMMCTYDVLNKVVLEANLNKCNTYEVSAFQELYNKKTCQTQSPEIYILDRGFASYDFLCWLTLREKFIVRLSKSCFKEVSVAFDDALFTDKTLCVQRPGKSKRRNNPNIVNQLNLRIIRILLENGTVEVLATNLTKKEMGTDFFKELYNFRWGIESFFKDIKELLTLENFTGTTVQNIQQDFWSTLFLATFESCLRQDVDEKLQKKETMNQQKVNKAVSYNALKNNVFDLFISKTKTEDILKKLYSLFETNPTQIRKKPSRPRIKSSTRTANHVKRRKKYIF
jgi:hypothetical protein